MSHRKAGDAPPVEAHSPDLDPFIKMFSRDEMGKTQTDMTAGEMRETRGHKRPSVLSKKKKITFQGANFGQYTLRLP